MKDILRAVSILLIMFLALSLISCFKWDNPVDADNISSQLVSPKNLRVDAITETTYKLSWTDSCEVEEGFKIDRKDGSGAWQINYATVGKNISEFAVDLSGITPEDIYLKWRVRAYHQKYLSGYSNEALLEPNTVANPVFSLAAGTYSTPQNVSITCATNGATIRYTTNGSDPTSSSTLFSSPILVSSQTIKARAYKELWTPSLITSADYYIGFASFAYVAGGTFNNDTSDVSLSSFYLGKYELTQADYQAVMGANPSYFSENPNNPVEQLSWFNAIEYCNRRSMLEGITPCYSYSSYGTNPDNWPSGWNSSNTNHTNVSCNWTANGYRLPTEAEWEFAARGGNQTHNYTYSGSNDINAVAWYSSNSSSTTHTVGGKLANELGLYDMSGNVWEWNWDIYGTYPSGAQNNPHGATSGSGRVRRGGCWGYSADYCTVSYRSSYYATVIHNYVGFRLLRVSP